MPSRPKDIVRRGTVHLNLVNHSSTGTCWSFHRPYLRRRLAMWDRPLCGRFDEAGCRAMKLGGSQPMQLSLQSGRPFVVFKNWTRLEHGKQQPAPTPKAPLERMPEPRRPIHRLIIPQRFVAFLQQHGKIGNGRRVAIEKNPKARHAWGS